MTDTVGTKWIICKEQILEAIDKKTEEVFPADNSKGTDYAKVLLKEFSRFRKAVEERRIFPLDNGGWRYSIVVRGSGIYLYLEYVIPKKLGIREKEKIDEQYEMISCKAELLKVEEYAELYDITHVAAVTRIRRGKIRSAVKVGKEWRIPSLAEPVERGYKSAVYSWHNRLSGLPNRYKIIEDYQQIEFFQDEEKFSVYHVRMTGTGIEPLEFVCDREKRSRIEQVLISHPDVICLSDEIMRIDRV